MRETLILLAMGFMSRITEAATRARETPGRLELVPDCMRRRYEAQITFRAMF